MHPASLGLTRANLLLFSGLWGWVMVRAGVWLVLELPHVLDVSSRWFRIGGGALVACGLFIFAYAAARCFPLASPRVKLACEMAPWVALTGFVIGGLV